MKWNDPCYMKGYRFISLDLQGFKENIQVGYFVCNNGNKKLIIVVYIVTLIFFILKYLDKYKDLKYKDFICYIYF